MTTRPGQRPLSELLEDYGSDDVRASEWYRFLADVRTLRDSGTYRWADVALATIARDVERTERVSPWQRRMVARIVATEYAPGRAFDKFGFGRRW